MADMTKVIALALVLTPSCAPNFTLVQFSLLNLVQFCPTYLSV